MMSRGVGERIQPVPADQFPTNTVLQQGASTLDKCEVHKRTPFAQVNAGGEPEASTDGSVNGGGFSVQAHIQIPLRPAAQPVANDGCSAAVRELQRNHVNQIALARA